MFIEEVVIEGFKSYATRTVISGFDREFNAITGLNGSGKSNILDAICFVLGISNLSQVRAANLQELVYKQGQAGITKAAVSVIFNNEDPRASPVGYESCRKVTVSREVVLGGRNRYAINGHGAQAAQVSNLFHSVQLNVNNPHFLIMQGRITKVLNMKAVEILGMIEEAAGTRMFESKKVTALKTLDKKATKVTEIERVLADEITPTLERLRAEKAKYLKYSANSALCSRLERLCLAHDFVEARSVAQRLHSSADEAARDADTKRSETVRVLEEAATADDAIRTSHNAARFDEIERAVADADKLVAQTSAALKHWQRQVTQEEARLAERESDRRELELMTARLREAAHKRQLLDDVHGAARAVALALSSSALSAPNLMDRVAALRDQQRDAEREVRRLDRELTELRDRQQRTAAKAREVDRLRQAERAAAAELDAKSHQLSALGVEQLDEDSEGVDWASQAQQWAAKAARLEAQIRARLAALDAAKELCPRGVRGTVARLVKPVDRKYCTALETVAGRKLFQIVVDDEHTGKSVLQRSKQRVTLIPLTRIAAPRKLARTDEYPAAIELVGYDKDLERAVGYVFGNAYVSETLDQARRVAFGKLRTRCVTLDGDSVSPAGVLTGGAAASNSGALLAKLYDYNEALCKQRDCAERATRHDRLQEERKRRRLAANEVDVAASKHRQAREALDLEIGDESQHSGSASSIEAATARRSEMTALAADCERQAQRLEEDRAAVERETQRDARAAERCARDAKNRLDAAVELETRLALEVDNATRLMQERDESSELASSQAALADAEQAHSKATERRQTAAADQQAAALERAERDKQAQKRDLLQAKARELDLETKRLEHTASRVARDAAQFDRRVEELMRAHPWIETEQRFFGQRGDYDFKAQTAEQARARLEALAKEQEELSTTINRRVMGAIESAEKEYDELRSKKSVVENDRAKIEAVIAELDVKKKETLDTTWRKVDRNFSSIFSSLLPSARAKLEPVDPLDILQGLQVKVGFGSIWKESLNELSGGQRSLVALSLVLAMLKFKPAPVYVLDEVDAALDLSHTQNIGTMLKTHFKDAQFIVVSLKEGMFNNANVVFRTKFVDGVSTISRTSNVALVTQQPDTSDDRKPASKKKRYQ